MPKVKIDLALSDNDRHYPLFTGEVQPEGIELNAFPMTIEEIFWRQAQFQEFDASEFAGGGYIMLKARNECPFTAIPIFPLRCFRQSSVWINTEAGVERPEDLKGKRIGAPEYEMTIMFWVRDFLEKDYGVKPSDMEWFTGGLRDPGRKPRVTYNLPESIKVHPPAGKALDQMLEDGEIDALISTRIPGPVTRGSRRIRRLFPKYWEVEADYWRRTRLFPIMHVVVLKNEIVEKYPWVPINLYKAMVEAKRVAIERLAHPIDMGATLPFLMAHIEHDRELMGEDFWPYGAEANRHCYGHLAKIAYEQHLAVREVPYEELFPRSFFDEFKI